MCVCVCVWERAAHTGGGINVSCGGVSTHKHAEIERRIKKKKEEERRREGKGAMK